MPSLVESTNLRFRTTMSSGLHVRFNPVAAAFGMGRGGRDVAAA